MVKKDKYQVMVNSNIKLLILKLSFPTIISMLITAIYNFADTFFVSGVHNSKAAISAVGVVFSFMAIIQAFGFFFGHGTGNFIARLLGQKDYEKAKTYAIVGVCCSFAFGLLIMSFGLIFLSPLTRFLTANKDEFVYNYAKDYLFWILLGAPFMTTSNTLNNHLRYQGNAFFAMVGIASGALLNIFLDPLFIKMYGVYGAGLSTFVSQILGFVLLYAGTFFGNNIRLNFHYFRIDKNILKNILNGGFPSLARQGLNAVSIAVLNLVAINYSVDALAAMTVVNRIMSFAISITMGIGQGFQPVCGVNYGAKQYKRLKEGFWFTTMLAVGFLIVFTLINIFCGDSLIKVFEQGKNNIENSEEFIKVAKELLILQSIAIPLFGFTTTANMMLQTMGKSVRATILAIGRQALFFIPTLFIMQSLFKFKGIEFSQMIADILCFLVAIPFMVMLFNEINKEIYLETQQ